MPTLAFKGTPIDAGRTGLNARQHHFGPARRTGGPLYDFRWEWRRTGLWHALLLLQAGAQRSQSPTPGAEPMSGITHCALSAYRVEASYSSGSYVGSGSIAPFLAPLNGVRSAPDSDRTANVAGHCSIHRSGLARCPAPSNQMPRSICKLTTGSHFQSDWAKLALLRA
jgi:hypothetical protein